MTQLPIFDEIIIIILISFIIIIIKKPLLDETADDAPAVAMEYKVHVDPGKEECKGEKNNNIILIHWVYLNFCLGYFQYVQKGATIYVSFQVN